MDNSTNNSTEDITPRKARPRSHKFRNLVLAGVVGAGLVGSAAAASAQTSSTTSPSSSVVPKQAHERGLPSKESGRPDEASRQADLASALGVSVDKVTAAEKAAHEAVDSQLGTPPKPPAERPSTPPSDADKAAHEAEMKARHDAFDTAFAKELGVSSDVLAQARLTAAQTHLAADVASGKLTQTQADEILAHVKSGDPGPGGPHGRGGPGGPGHGPHADGDQAPPSAQ